MYNKLFTKILDSSIWMEPSSTRIVWLTLIAVMDEDGFAQFAGVPNLAHRAVVTVEEAATAVKALESPDPDSSDPDNDGRRIERVPGGWIILNATKYRQIVTRIETMERNRQRVAAYRAKKKGVTVCNGCNKTLQERNATVMQSEAEAESEAESKKKDLPRQSGGSGGGTRSRKAANASGSRKARPSANVDDSDFLEGLQAKPAYSHLNVRHQLDRMTAWCEVNGKKPTRRRLVNWLNREDKPIAGSSPADQKTLAQRSALEGFLSMRKADKGEAE